jgi:methylenetetrahydrofolate dehydrogenase (NADP+) / methenyltetrahydrofolate cyclohydrolase
MTATLLDGDALAALWRLEIKAEVASLHAAGVRPALASVLIGDDPASAVYVGRKHADCHETGITARDIRLPTNTTQAELLDCLAMLNATPGLHGVLVQLPTPAHLDGEAAILAIDPAKDIDGLHPMNLGRLLSGAEGLQPCTPAAIIGLLQAYDIPLSGRRVAVIGRGPLVGRPLALMLSCRDIDAVVTVLHSGVMDLKAITRECDVVISAAGSPGLVTADMIAPDAAVVGVGITYVDGRMVSDIAADVAAKAAFVTPPHGSVGPLTRAMLLKNLIRAARLSQ